MTHVTTAAIRPTRNVSEAYALAEGDMQCVNALIRQSLISEAALIHTFDDPIIAGDGRRLRPTLHVLAAHAAGYTGDHHITLAVVIEFIHTATRLHSQVRDASGLGRDGKPTDIKRGNAQGVLLGDFLYSRASQLTAELRDMRVMRILADTTNAIAEGEVLRLLAVGYRDVDEAAYQTVVERRTAVLFATAAQLGGVLGGLAEAQVAALRRYGMQLGCAIQIADDLRDAIGTSDVLGRHRDSHPPGVKPTPSSIPALPQSDGILQARAMRQGINDDGISSALRAPHAMERARQRVLSHGRAAQEALAWLPASPYRAALATLADGFGATDVGVVTT